MPYVTFLARHAKEQLRIEGRLETIESVLQVRFPVSALLTAQMKQVGKLGKLHELLEAAKTAPLANIESAIQSAVPLSK